MSATRVAAAVRPADSSSGDAVGAWSRRLADVGVSDLGSVSASLKQLSAELASERSEAAAAVDVEMRAAHAKAAGAAARAQQLASEVVDIHDALAATRSHPSDATLGSVHTLAQVKQRMIAARDVLLAAEAWSQVEPEVSRSIAEHQWERAAKRIAESQRSLANFDADSEYVATRRTVLERLLAMFDAAVAKGIIDAVHTDDVSGVARCASLFRTVDRLHAFTSVYLAARASRILAAWTDAQDAGRMFAALEALVADEHARYACLAIDSPAQLAAAVLESLEPPLADHVAAQCSDVARLVHTFERAAAAAAAIYSTAPGDWLAGLARAFAPAQREYDALEAARFAAAWADTATPLSTALDRVWVRTSSPDPGVWAACVSDVGGLIDAHRSAALDLLEDASTRMLRFTAGSSTAALLTTAQARMLEPVYARVHSAIESLRMRYVRYAAAAPHRSDDSDAVADWDIVRAAIGAIGASCALSDSVEQWQRSTIERGRAAVVQHAGATGTLSAACLALADADTLRRVRGDGAALDAALNAATSARAGRVLASAQGLVLDVLLSSFRQQLDEYRSAGAPAGAEAPSAAIDKSLRMPSFSRSPSEAMSRLGEGLLNMPRLLEAFVDKEFDVLARGTAQLPHAPADRARAHRSVSATLLASEEAPAATAPEHVLSAWLRAFAMTLVTQLCDRTLPAVVARAYDRAQLATDVDYLGTIAAALNAPSEELREWAQVLAAESVPAQSPLRGTAAYAAVYANVR